MRLFARIRRLLAAGGVLVVVGLPGAAVAVEDCFSDFCTGAEDVIAFQTIYVIPSGTAGSPGRFTATGALEYDLSPGPELFALAGEAFIGAGSTQDTAIDRIRLRLQVHDSLSQNRLAAFNLFVSSAEYEPAVPGTGGHALVAGAGIVNDGATRRVAVIALMVPIGGILAGDSGIAHVQLFDLDGNSLWQRRFPQTLGPWSLLRFEQGDSFDATALVGDFLNDDGTDELRVIYNRTDPNGREFFEYRYHQLSNGAQIRRDVVTLIAP